MMLTISTALSGSPNVHYYWNGTVYYIYYCLGRQIFGICLSYLLALIVTAKPD